MAENRQYDHEYKIQAVKLAKENHRLKKENDFLEEARKSDDLLKRDFHADEPLTKCVTDITEIKASDGKRYVSAVFDGYDSSVIGLAMDTNMKAPLCVQTLENTTKAYPDIRGAIIHSDRGEPVHQPGLLGCGQAVRHTAEHEQHRRQMPR